jgi:hypothetical protein
MKAIMGIVLSFLVIGMQSCWKRSIAQQIHIKSQIQRSFVGQDTM